MPKNIIVCCDGTGNKYGQHNTNVVKLYEAIVRDAKQIAFYDPGVGTFSILGRELGRRVGTGLGKAFGAGVQRNIEDAYRYLMNRYEPEDKVFLFGFSRGAFTVRALEGMLNQCGLLEKGSVNLVPYASKIYNNRARHAIAPGFKQTYCPECHPYFIGVWDTVGSMGWFWGRKCFDATLHEDVRHAYQAVSINEQRRKFPPSLWHEPGGQERIEQVWCCRNQVCSMSSFICSPRRSTSFVGSSTWAGAPGSSRMSPPPMLREQVRETTRIRRRPRDFDSSLTAACVSTIGSITPGRPQRRCAECSRHECRVESSASSCPGSVGRSSRAVSGSISAI